MEKSNWKKISMTGIAELICLNLYLMFYFFLSGNNEVFYNFLFVMYGSDVKFF